MAPVATAVATLPRGLVVERMLHAFAEQPTLDGTALERLVRHTNQAVIDARVPDTERANMHATVVSLVIDFMHHQAAWAHAGDSRLYWFRDGLILAKTRDHSLVQSLVDAGLLAADQARSHPKRSELRSALGIDAAALQVDHSGQPQAVHVGDVFLLCSDGVWEHITEPQLEYTLQGAGTPRDWLSALEREVGEATRHKASHDNFTAMGGVGPRRGRPLRPAALSAQRCLPPDLHAPVHRRERVTVVLRRFGAHADGVEHGRVGALVDEVSLHRFGAAL